MTDVPRLLAAFADGRLRRPSAAVPNTVDLACALASLCGVPGIQPGGNASRIADSIGAHEHFVFVLVDGLGMHLLEREPDGFLATHAAMELQSVFPSSTAPALTSLATGAWPGEHAVPGWFTYLPDAGITSTILPFVERYTKRDARELGVSLSNALPLPVLARRMPRRQLRVMPWRIHGSVYSRYSSADCEAAGYTSLRSAVDTVANFVETQARPSYTYLYISIVDTAGHEHGRWSKPARRAYKVTQDRIAGLAARLEGRARIIVTADHGQIDIQAKDQVDLLPGDPMLDLLVVPPTCEPRVPAFHVRDGKHAAFESHFRGRLGERFALLTVDEADELRLFGPAPLSAETRRRLGDYVAVALGPAALLHRLDHPMVGFHGGLHPEEVRVPLILV